MGSAESHQVDSVPTEGYDGSASKPSASLGARHTVDEPSNPLFNPAVMADSSRQAMDLIVAPAAVCPGSHPSVSVSVTIRK